MGIKQLSYSSLVLFFLLLFGYQAESQTISRGAVISVLTCDPGKDIYSMYGHTAIRVVDREIGIDVVFNYGVFSFDSPNFIYRFAKGQTDYMIVAERFSSWMPQYEEEHRSVYEQVLDLPYESKNRLFEALVENARPENRVYRYNFFDDNCATRVRDIIEKNIDSQISFNIGTDDDSYRSLIKQYHGAFRWVDMGIDLLVGVKADRPVLAYDQMFLPEYLKSIFARSVTVFDGQPRALVSKTRILLEYPNSKLERSFPWPSLIFGFLFVVVAAYTVYAFVKKKNTDKLDYWLLSLSGLVGLAIGWFVLFSEHPAMSPNFNLMWAFPLNLIFAGVWAVKKWRRYTQYYFGMMAVLLISSFFSSQEFNMAVCFIVLLLLSRALVHLFSLE